MEKSRRRFSCTGIFAGRIARSFPAFLPPAEDEVRGAGEKRGGGDAATGVKADPFTLWAFGRSLARRQGGEVSGTINLDRDVAAEIVEALISHPVAYGRFYLIDDLTGENSRAGA